MCNHPFKKENQTKYVFSLETGGVLRTLQLFFVISKRIC